MEKHPLAFRQSSTHVSGPSRTLEVRNYQKEGKPECLPVSHIVEGHLFATLPDLRPPIYREIFIRTQVSLFVSGGNMPEILSRMLDGDAKRHVREEVLLSGAASSCAAVE